MNYILLSFMLMVSSVSAQETLAVTNSVNGVGTFNLNYRPSLSISAGKTIVTIHPDGKITYADGVTPDEAALEFWNAVQKIGMKLSCGDK